MNDNMIFETLKGLGYKKESTTKRKDPPYNYLDENDNQIKEIPLSKLDSAGALINYKSAKLIHNSIFGK